MPEALLAWTRPDFLALRYELASEAGVAASVSVSGMGDSRHALAETSDGVWRFEVFPFGSSRVRITGAADDAELGSYLRNSPFEIHLAAGALYRMTQHALEAQDGQLVFSYEQVESFPRWRADVKLAPGAEAIPELPLLVVAGCCIRVFR